jgi:hypothetical protein
VYTSTVPYSRSHLFAFCQSLFFSALRVPVDIEIGYLENAHLGLFRDSDGHCEVYLYFKEGRTQLILTRLFYRILRDQVEGIRRMKDDSTFVLNSIADDFLSMCGLRAKNEFVDFVRSNRKPDYSAH